MLVPGVREQNLRCALNLAEDHTVQCPQIGSRGAVREEGWLPLVSQVAGEALSCVDSNTRCFQCYGLRNRDCP